MSDDIMPHVREYVAVKHLASELGMDRSLTRKFILKLGVTPAKRRLADSRGALALVVTAAEADFIRGKRREGWVQAGADVAVGKESDTDCGSFYLIRVVPDLDPRRLKLGFAWNVSARLAEHRIAAPTAEVLRSWPCRRHWEQTAIDALGSGCRLIMGEVFECDDVPGLLEKGDLFFSLLPAPDSRSRLAECSPHNT